MFTYVFIDSEDDNKILGKSHMERQLKVGQGVHINDGWCRPILKIEEKTVGKFHETWIYLGKLPDDFVKNLANQDILLPPEKRRKNTCG